jgi:hypothetical protein
MLKRVQRQTTVPPRRIIAAQMRRKGVRELMNGQNQQDQHRITKHQIQNRGDVHFAAILHKLQ